MSVFNATTGPRSDPDERRWMRTPATGWISVILLVVLVAAAGVIVDAPGLAGTGPGGLSQTAFLPWLMVAGVIAALVAHLLGIRSALAYLAGGAVGAALLLVAVGGALSDAADPIIRVRAVEAAGSTLIRQVLIDGVRTTETVGFLFVVGAVGWTTGFFAGWNAFRRGFVAPAFVAVGSLVAVTCLSPAVDLGPLYPVLVLLTGAALLLAVRGNLAGRRRRWTARGFIDSSSVDRIFLAGGVAVSVVALVIAAGVASRLTAAPLADAWRSIDRIPQVLEDLDRLFGDLGSRSIQGSGSFGERATLQTSWSSTTEVVFTVVAADGVGRYWRGAAYETFDGRQWLQDRGRQVRVAAGSDLLSVAGSVPDGSPGRETVGYEVTAASLAGDTLLVPGEARTVDREVIVAVPSGGGPANEIEPAARFRRGGGYAIEAEILREGADGVTGARLAAAGLVYPAWAVGYTRVEPGTLSESAAGAAAAVVAELPEDRRDPYHVAQALEAWLARAGGFRYVTDLNGACRPGEGVVDCLLRTRAGFCQQYATALTLMLRSRSIPSRYVQGYLPGRRLADGTWSVDASAAHAWVEVWFPGWGWVRFDPTPGGNAANGQSTSSIPNGRPVTTPPPDPTQPEPTPVFTDEPSLEPTPSPSPTPLPFPTPAGTPAPPSSGGAQGPIVALLLIVIGIAVLLVIGRRLAEQRALGHDAEGFWRAIVAGAARSGIPTPGSATPYETASAIEDDVPEIAVEVREVARAKVERTYGRSAGDAVMDGRLRAAARVVLRVLRRHRPRG